MIRSLRDFLVENHFMTAAVFKPYSTLVISESNLLHSVEILSSCACSRCRVESLILGLRYSLRL